MYVVHMRRNAKGDCTLRHTVMAAQRGSRSALYGFQKSMRIQFQQSADGEGQCYQLLLDMYLAQLKVQRKLQ
jgi:hypothetical protein